MKAELQNINRMYIEVEYYFYPAPGFFDSEINGSTYLQRKKELEPLYQSARKELYRIAPSLTTGEIIQAYQEGCRLLQANISGLMVESFRREYIPIMIQAIKDNHGHTAHMFLRTLSVNASDLRSELTPLILVSLSSQFLSIKEAALSAAFQLRLTEALPTIKRMAKDSTPEIREMSENILANWNQQT